MVRDVAHALVRAASRLSRRLPKQHPSRRRDESRRGTHECVRHVALLLAATALAFAAPPQRIVSTAPSITELLYALGLGDNVAGVTRFCRYPPEAQLKPKIGDYTSPNLESIAALRPDLVIVQTNPVRLRERLEAIKLHVLEINQDSVTALYTSITQVGAATQTDAKAATLVRNIRNHLDQIQSRASKLSHPKVMFVVGRTPQRLDGLIVVGQASYLNDLITIAGGVNVFSDARASYPAVSLEDVLARNPDVVLDMGEMGEASEVSQKLRDATINLWKRAGSLNAVRQGQVVPIGSDIYVIPGPRIVLAADDLFRIFHPGTPVPIQQRLK